MNAPLNFVPSRRTTTARLSSAVKAMARDCGLDVSAITSADLFDGLEEKLRRHVRDGRVDGLDWFTEERAEFSVNPRNLMPTARSILSVGVSYWSTDSGKPNDGVPRGRIARYARGVDYHKFLKKRMKDLHARIEQEVGHSVEARMLTDTARIVDRAVAARAGLGWYGKHSCIIVPGHGSWVLLGEMILDIDLEPDEPLHRDCGRCTFCIDRCPTDAIVAPYTVHAPRCLSFQTIEQRDAIPVELRPLLGDWVFGCDVCQDVCPYTRAAKPSLDPTILPKRIENAYPSLSWMLEVSEDEFREVYQGTPVLRAKRRGLARNAAVALGNEGDRTHVAVLGRVLAEHDEPLVRGHAAWALGRLGGRTAKASLERRRLSEQDPYVRTEIVAALEQHENPSGEPLGHR